MTAPWDQLAGESAKAYAAFCLYRDLGPRRSLDEASRRYHHPSGTESTPAPARRAPRATGTVRRWAQDWNWLSRASAWDKETERIKQMEQHAAIQEMAERHAKEALMLQNKAVERLRLLRPEELKVADTLNYLIAAAKLERLARGEPTERVAEEHRIIEDVKELTDEELSCIIAAGRSDSPSRRRVATEADSPQEPA
jgi:hypothetical protein